MPHARMAYAALALALAAPAAAEDSFPLADDPVLGALVAQTLESHPVLAAWSAEIAAARARVPQAGTLPDPMVSALYENGGMGLGLGSDPDTGLGLRLAQDFPGAGKRGRAAAVEAREVERMTRERERERRALLYRVRKAYADLLLARENLALIEDQRRATRDIEELTRSRYAVGLAGQPEVLRTQAELARLDQMTVHERGNEVAAVAALNALAGRPPGTEVPPGPTLGALAGRAFPLPSVDAVVAHAEQMSPHVRVAEAAVERARAALEVARASTRPDFSLAGEYLNRGSLPAMWGVEVGVVLPLRKGSRQRQAIVEAEARLRAEEARRDGVRREARAMAQRNLAELDAAVREAQAYEKGVLMVDDLAVESAMASYQTGKIPFVSVLEAHNTRYRDRYEYVELLFHVLWHSASLDQYSAVPEGEANE